jgi:hypothetical protein
MVKQLLKLNKIAKRLGYKPVISYYDLYRNSEAAYNTFTFPQCSVWVFTIIVNENNKICGIEVNTTYFAPTQQAIELSKFTLIPKTFDEVIKFMGANNIK